jgi:hypothetical protein
MLGAGTGSTSERGKALRPYPGQVARRPSHTTNDAPARRAYRRGPAALDIPPSAHCKPLHLATQITHYERERPHHRIAPIGTYRAGEVTSSQGSVQQCHLWVSGMVVIFRMPMW